MRQLHQGGHQPDSGPPPAGGRRLALALFAVLAVAEIWLVVEAVRASRGLPVWFARPLPLAGATAVGMAGLAALCLLPGPGTAGGRPLAGEPVLAEERHRSLRRAAINTPFLLLLPLAAWLAPSLAWRALVAGLALALLPIIVWLFAGFRYRLRPSGLEVRAPGLRLAFVTADSMKAVEVCAVRPLRDWGGWGVRGSGRRRAYIWDGQRAVRLRLEQGEIILGHDDPERLARMLAWTYLGEDCR